MWLFWALIVVEIVSMLVCLSAVRRLYKYIKRYRFDETVYTLLFGFMHLRYFAYAYFLSITLLTIAGVIFAFSLLSYGLSA